MKKPWEKSKDSKTMRDVILEPAADHEIVGSDGGDGKMSQDSSILGEGPPPKPQKDIFDFEILKNNFLSKTGKYDRQKQLD